jgi:hypothetical protein
MTGCSGAGGGGPGTKYTYAQLEGLWINAGGPKAEAPIAAAIALAESGGCSSDLNPTDNGGTQTSWGLWQISNGTHNPPVPGILTPATNAQQAVAKYKSDGNTFGDWGTYTSGAYRAFVNGSTTPDTSVPSPTGSAVLDAAQVSDTCLWGLSLPGGAAGGWIQGAIQAAGGGGAWGLVDPASGKSSGVCILSRSAARAILAGSLLFAGGIVMLPGVVILSAFAFRAGGGPQKVMAAASFIPGVAPEARLATAAGAAASRTVPKGSAAPARATAPATP